jgi:hypothetical protein
MGIDDLKSGDHFSTDSVLKQYLILALSTHKQYLSLALSTHKQYLFLALSTHKQYLTNFQ